MKTVGLIFGGASHEHEVSLKSAKTFLQKIDYKNYEVIPFMISSEGKWIQYAKVTKPIKTLGDLWIDNPLLTWNNDVDIYFPLIHGETGEDGKLQGFFEIMNVKYVGCDVESSAIGMNKILSKEVANIIGGASIVPYEIIRKIDFERIERYTAAIGYPLFVKPARAGSSVGVSKVNSETELLKALKTAFEIDKVVLLEKAIVGKEIEVGVIGRERVESSVVGEIEYASEFYDYQNKYNLTGSVMHIPARMNDELYEEAKMMAENIYKAIGCSGYARVDFFLEEETNQLYFNEINTSPGMTDKSMFPVLFSNKYTFTELLSNIIEDAFAV